LSRSGAWWANRDIVLRVKPEEQITCAGASLRLFDVADGIAMTRDWLDCCVEHLSKLPKHFEFYGRSYTKDDATFRRIVEIFQAYPNRVESQLQGVETAPTRETIAVLPMYETEEPGQKMDSFLSLEAQPTGKERTSVLQMYQLAGTLASLWQIGIARAVVVGHKRETPELVKAAFAIIEHMVATGDETVSMELAYWPVAEVEKYKGKVLMPRLATKFLQMALKNEMEPTQVRSLLGDAPSRWRYVYFTEPDLIIHFRSGALGQFRDQLDRGIAIAPTRLQVMPHAVDFPHLSDPTVVVPNMGNFSNFQDLDPETDACCDGGSIWPGLDEHEQCGDGLLRFYQCGFRRARDAKKKNHTEAEVFAAHKRLLKYPMIRLTKTGLGVLLIHNHGRICYRADRGTCTTPVSTPPFNSTIA